MILSINSKKQAVKQINQKWREQVLSWLRENVSAHRVEHILGVEKTCLDLAKLHNISPKKAAKAGLLHDLAKFFPPKKLLKIASKAKIEVDPICQNHPHLIHADVSAVLAKTEFGITNKDILNAIRNHTLGNPQMSALSCIVYIADCIEPGRGNNSELSKIRHLATQNLYQATWATGDYTLNYLVGDRKVIHPRTVLTRNWALSRSSSSKI